MNVLTAAYPEDAAEQAILTGDALNGFEKYFTDESRRVGTAVAVALPRTTAEVCSAVKAAAEQDLSVTVSAARTGIAAGAVPDGGMLLSLERLSRIRGLRKGDDGTFYVTCEAGVLLADLQKSVLGHKFADSATWDTESLALLEEMKKERLFYPPDPTETSAAVGGTVACNASGAHTFLYGPTRPYVEWIRVVLADGSCVDLRRGEHKAGDDGSFELVCANGSVRKGHVPSYPWPNTKNSGGYFSGPGMDLIDLFIGSEGTLGIITEIEVRVVPAPELNCAVMTFWASEAAALRFTQDLRGRKTDLGVEAIEYVDPNALNMLRRRRTDLGAASGVPECLPEQAAAAIYLDIGCPAKDMERVLSELGACVESCGGDPELCWSAMAGTERERLRVFRHALPETVNSKIAEIRQKHPGVTKLGTDMAVPNECLCDIMALYREHLDKAGLDYVIFGHIGDNHVHVNILPQTPEQYAKGKELYQFFAGKVVGMGGSPAAEHGIGKLKTAFLTIMYGEEGVDQMRAVKTLFDPDQKLGPGTLFG